MLWHATSVRNLGSGQVHAFLLLDEGRVLDKRFDEVVQYGRWDAAKSACILRQLCLAV
jgi:hypothetical protein